MLVAYLYNDKMWSSRKYPFPPQRWSLEILKGRGVSIADIFKRKFEAKLEIPGGWEGLNQITIPGGGMDILKPHNKERW